MIRRLEGKVALVTGSTSGIGYSTVRLFAQEGARVVLTGRKRELGEEAVRTIRHAGGEASYFQADFADAQAVRDTVRYTLDSYGRIDILMNNAVSWAEAQEKSVTDLREEDWDHAMAIGLKAPYIACQEAIPHMRRQGGGSIIMTGSVRSFLAFRKGFAYDTVKAGLVNMARQLNLDYGREGIRANTLCPGQIVTDPQRLTEMQTNPLLRPFAEIIQPIGRPGQPIDVARAALFLASDESSFVAGAILVVDGGLTIQTPGSLLPQLEAYYRQAFAEEWGIRLA
ncbi:MAG: SDR family oxidoreductase [Acidobacteria bacterium]|nr:SDR family oxidoreductase [Acidobacteriota bacterium]